MTVVLQCDQIGLFFIFLAKKYLTEVAKYLGNFFCFVKNSTFKFILFGYLLGNFYSKFGYFLFQHLVTLVLGMTRAHTCT